MIQSPADESFDVDSKNFIQKYEGTTGWIAECRRSWIAARIRPRRPSQPTSASTRSVVDRIDAGETVEDVARDYDFTPEVIEEAVVYERAV